MWYCLLDKRVVNWHNISLQTIKVALYGLKWIYVIFFGLLVLCHMKRNLRYLTLKRNKILYPLGQAWQSGSALAA